jgi:hypothetical protein
MTAQDESQNVPENTTAAPRRRLHSLRRAGCLAALVVWFVILLTPCAFFLLATQEQITITLGAAPEQTLRIWLINEVKERGVGISWASVTAENETGLCVQTNTRFILWMGKADNATFCACYTRQSPAASWMPGRAYSGACEP